MKAAVHVNHAEHQRVHGAAIAAGLARHGVKVVFAPFDAPAPCDVAVVWGWRQARVIAAAPRVLVMERGHVGDRMAYTSCGWDGLAGRGRYPAAPDGGARWERLHGALMRPWREGGGDHALLIGQVTGDAALSGLTEGFPAWAQSVTDALRARGVAVRYRPHPVMALAGDRFCPAGATRSTGTLAEALAGAAFVVSYNSTAGVDAALAGVPVVALDRGAMAWPVAAHAIGETVRPDRTRWAHDLAWCQWSLAELADGTAWAALAEIMPERDAA